ncbi:MAG: hypothetical protein ACFFCZ_14785 [Promethearchaeota archaeon]
MSETPRRTPRSMLERAKDIFRVINSYDEPFAKTRLIEANISPKAAEKWLDLIIFIQSQPRIKLTKTGHNTIVERIEGKYSVMSLKTFLDEDVPVETRLHSLMDYSKEVFSRELRYRSNKGEDSSPPPYVDPPLPPPSKSNERKEKEKKEE